MPRGDQFERYTPWGHVSPPIQPRELLDRVAEAARAVIATYAALPEGPINCNDMPGFQRVAVLIPLDQQLFDQLMNGESGYRAHYAKNVDTGEAFNTALVEVVAPQFVAAESLYIDKFSRQFCDRSLRGRFSKFWYPKALTDPSANAFLQRFSEELLVPSWRNYWLSRAPPRKGLLAPLPEEPAVLLNGTFVDTEGENYEQKPGRSQELHQHGWT